MKQEIASLRKEYSLETLNEQVTAADPFTQFGYWWNQATASEISEQNAMTLSTVSPEGKPSSRIVLLKGFDTDGFVFFTNYDSRKGQEMATNPNVSLVFFWKELERQVRIEGMVSRLRNEDNDEYFASRPEGSKIGAWSSPQSEVIDSRLILEQNQEKYRSQFREGGIPRPPHWGGYLVQPEVVEFWQGRESRLHDRIRYRKQGEEWLRQRLAP